MVDFAGWEMPIQYGSIIEEHRAVRNRAGLFDVSHMGRIEFRGKDALPWLEQSLSNHVEKLGVGKIQYSLLLNDLGGVVDDVLVYRTPEGYDLVCNASNRVLVTAKLLERQGTCDARLIDQTKETAMIAIQGPNTLNILEKLIIGNTLNELKYYHSTRLSIQGIPLLVSRTGYTGEDGFELIVPSEEAQNVWEQLLDAGQNHGVMACGLGARDTLRLEAGMPLHGHEISETIDPYSSNLQWAVKLEKGDFVGRDALVARKNQLERIRVGLIMRDKRIARHGATVFHNGQEIGVVTSGGFSPTLEKPIALALIKPEHSAIGTQIEVNIRGRHEPADLVALPFYRRARS